MTTPPRLERSSGVLLHVSSLPGPFGIGDLGPAAHRWVEWLADSGSKYWQILPLGPPGLGNSPYSSTSSQAGSVDLISPEGLVEDGLLDSDRLEPIGEQGRVDFKLVRDRKRTWLEEALGGLAGPLRTEFDSFRTDPAVVEYSLFMAISESRGGERWFEWPASLRQRDPEALARAGEDLSETLEYHAFTQFVFERQLAALRSHAAEQGVVLLGDVPLYVAGDSVDVWTHPDLFTLDEIGRPTHIAGVPPDEFSDTGQVWGTPLYQWDRHAETGYVWWAERLRSFFRHADVLRIDHFIGLVTYYSIEAHRPDAVVGEWLPGPGIAFFEALERQLGAMDLVVEDLGHLTPPVEQLRVELGYPGMTLLQDVVAAEGDLGDIGSDQVVYTGTHDNDTAAGSYTSGTDVYRASADRLLGTGTETAQVEIARRFVEGAWRSPGVIAIAPMQDLLGLGSEARMNHPGTPKGNWEWRMESAPSPDVAARLLDLNQKTDRTV